MDRAIPLQEAYHRAYELGEELLKALREPPTPAVVDRVHELVSRRDDAARAAVSLFQPGDQVQFREHLEALVKQQQVLDSEMRRFVNELEKIANAAVHARSTVRGARQMISSGRRGRMLDEKR